MSHEYEKRTWRQRLGRLASELVVVFAGVTAAFVVENYRENRNQIAEMHQAVSGIISELTNAEVKGGKYSDAILADINRWEQAEAAGKQAVPAHYRIPGAPHPPTAAWNSMVSSGLARMLEPKLRIDLGYFYSEFLGVHDNYDRYNQFTEREVLTRELSGPGAFYGPDGHLLPMFRVHMDLQKEFAQDLRRLCGMAHDLRTRLETVQSSR